MSSVVPTHWYHPMSGLAVRTHWYHPEWCVVALATTGWLSLLLASTTEPALVLGMPEVHTPAEALEHSAVMAAAMMAPLVVAQVNHVAVFSVWRRRYRAAAEYLLGYLGIWTLAGAALMVGGSAAAELLGWRPTIVMGFIIATAAVARPTRRRLVRQCWTTRPLAMGGWRADRDCVQLGALMAQRCIATSWALMLAVMVEHGLIMMAAATAVTLAERRGRLKPDKVVAATVALGLTALALATIAGSLHQLHRH